MAIDTPAGAVTSPVASDAHPGQQTLLILGASGDLTARLLLPGLGGLLARGGGAGMQLLGSGMEAGDDEWWRARVRAAFASVTNPSPAADPTSTPAPPPAPTDPAVTGPPATDPSATAAAALSRTVDSSHYVAADVTSDDDVRRLLDACHGQVIIYFALPPEVTARTCEVLARIGVPQGTTLVLEKPFGHDRASAEHLNHLLTRIVPEDHVHRVDHFLGKSTVLNILGLRFANRIFEPLLNAEHVASVDIVFDEGLGLEGRARYYDRAGALADMIQSHLLQVLALFAMEPVPTLDERELRDRQAEVLRATRVWGHDPVRSSRRARYTAGTIHGRDLPAYVDEQGVDPSRSTETLAEVVLAVDTWRWAGVPFRLRSGKALSSARKEAVVTFKRPARVPDGLRGVECPDRLRIAFGPDTLHLDLNVNGPADPFELDHVSLRTTFGPGELPPYGEVLRGVLDGDPLLSVRGDTAEECWRIVRPVLDAWHSGAVPMQDYPAGATGPGDTLLSDDPPS